MSAIDRIAKDIEEGYKNAHDWHEAYDPKPHLIELAEASISTCIDAVYDHADGTPTQVIAQALVNIDPAQIGAESEEQK